MGKRLKPRGKYVKSIFSEDYRGIIDKLKKVRKQRKMTQKDLAERMGWPHWSYISKIETYERKLDCAEFARIAKILKKPVAYFTAHIKV